MGDNRIEKMARVLVDYSVDVQAGDRVLIEGTTAAEDLARAVYRRVIERGGHPHLVLYLPDQEEILLRTANPEQLDFVPTFNKLAADKFESRIRIYSETNTRAFSDIDPARLSRRQKAISAVQSVILRRAAEGKMRWISTL